MKKTWFATLLTICLGCDINKARAIEVEMMICYKFDRVLMFHSL